MDHKWYAALAYIPAPTGSTLYRRDRPATASA